jgi:cobalt/nickel transport system permease protein
MHIPDGFVSPVVAIAGAAVAVAGLAVCVRRAGRVATERQLPLAGLAAAAFLAVTLLGPWLGPVVITVVTVVQAAFFGDGGLSALGLNVVNLALVPAAVGYPVLLGLRRLLPRGSMGLAVAAGVAAAISVLAAAVLFTAEYAVGGIAGLTLRTVAVSTIGVYAVVALAEGVVTALVVRALLALRADLVPVAQR